jgi:toxin ParE1/3/4
VRFALHPEAALEHEKQAAYYESKSSGLGRRYHMAFLAALERVCETPHRYKLAVSPDIRRFALRGFPFYILYRESDGTVQVLAVAHDRRRPGYWAGRL